MAHSYRFYGLKLWPLLISLMNYLIYFFHFAFRSWTSLVRMGQIMPCYRKPWGSRKYDKLPLQKHSSPHSSIGWGRVCLPLEKMQGTQPSYPADLQRSVWILMVQDHLCRSPLPLHWPYCLLPFPASQTVQFHSGYYCLSPSLKEYSIAWRGTVKELLQLQH